jgi:hypothetical protein
MVLALFPGCGRGHPGASASWEGDSLPSNDSATTIVFVDAAALSRLAATSLSPALVIGTGRGGETDEFGWIAGIAIDAARRIYVSDPAAHRVRVYNADGSFVRDIGRRGSGPGEFSALHGELEGRGVNGIAISGDTLFALNDRLVAFDTAGTFLYSSPPDRPYNTAGSLTATINGIVVDRRLPRGGNYDALVHMFTLETPATGTDLMSFSAVERYVDFDNRGFFYRKPSPLPFLPFTVGSDGLVYMATTDSFTISAVNLNGHVDRVFAANLPRVKVSDGDISDLGVSVERLVNDRTTGDVSTGLSRMIERGPRVEYRPAIGALVISEKGTLFVQRTDASAHPFRWYDQQTKAEWVMIDSAGVPRARFLLPNGFRAKVLSGCDLYGVEELEDGAQTAVRYSLGRSIPDC